jgi:hypothetical protein
LDEKEKNIMPICGGKNGFGQAYVPRMFWLKKDTAQSNIYYWLIGPSGLLLVISHLLQPWFMFMSGAREIVKGIILIDWSRWFAISNLLPFTILCHVYEWDMRKSKTNHLDVRFILGGPNMGHHGRSCSKKWTWYFFFCHCHWDRQNCVLKKNGFNHVQ